MKTEWLADVNGQEYGPYTWQQMLQMAAEGRVPPELPVRRVQDKQWYKAGQIPGLLSPQKDQASGPAVVAKPARTTSKSDSSHLKRAKPLSSAGAAPAAAPPPPPPVTASTSAAMPSIGQIDDPPAPPVAAPIVVVTDSAKGGKTTGAASTAELPDRTRRGRPMLMIAGIVGGLLAASAAAVGVVLYLSRTPPAASTDGAIAAASVTSSAGSAKGQDKTPAAASEKAEDSAANSTKGSAPSKAELDAQAKTVQSISAWQSIASVKSFGVSNASLQVTHIWRTDAAANGQEKGSGAKYVCIEVAIRNMSGSPLKYRGWNSYGANGAILADESNRVLPLVPVEKTPDLRRMTGGSVAGNGNATELLVFEAPASDEEVLHLVLPYGVFYSNVRPPYRAIELTPDLVGMDLASHGLAGGGRRSPAGGAESLRSQIDGEPAPQAVAANGAQPKGEDKAAAKKPKSLKEMIESEVDDKEKTAKEGGKKADDKEKAKNPSGKDAKKPENPFEPKPDSSS